MPGQAMTPKLKVTASLRGGVESNWKRTGSPQDDELDSAGYDDEPAHSWRSPEIAQHAGNGGESDAGAHFVVGGGMLGSLCEISGETCCRGDGSRSQNLRCTARLWSGPRPNGWGNWRHAWRASLVPKPCEATGKARLAKPCRGKEGRKVDARNLEEARGNEVTTVLETAKQVTAIDGWGSQTWIDRGIWTDRMLAALGNGVKGNKWFSLIDKVYRPQTLAAAWEQVRANKGAAGIDGQSCERFAADAERYLRELAEELREGRYRPEPVRRVEIDKSDGKKRPLGIPTVKDRIAQAAVKRVIEPIFEREFLPTSHGFRPGRGCKDALRAVDELLKKGYSHVVDADLKGYFDSIPHARLQARIEERISDGRLLELLAGWLQQDIIKGCRAA